MLVAYTSVGKVKMSQSGNGIRVMYGGEHQGTYTGKLTKENAYNILRSLDIKKESIMSIERTTNHN